MNRRPLTEEEKRLWHYVTRHDVPLHGVKDVEGWKEGDVEKEIRSSSSARSFRISAAPHIPTSPPLPLPLTLGAYAGIDARTAERFRRGEYAFDATLDLHGMSREKAHIRLNSFLHQHYEQGSRCLLVITGKGKAASLTEAPRGILRELLPQWLAEPGLRAMVLAFDVARPQHGGQGAYYILLRRRRG